jgi:hypothetical protein
LFEEFVFEKFSSDIDFVHGNFFLKNIGEHREIFFKKNGYKKCAGFGGNGQLNEAKHFVEYHSFGYKSVHNHNFVCFENDNPVVSKCARNSYCKEKRCKEDSELLSQMKNEVTYK